MISKSIKVVILFLSFLITFTSCKKTSDEKKTTENNTTIVTPKGMVWVTSKTFLKGAKASDKFAMAREKPAHIVRVDGFYIDETEVTNKQFKKFIEGTNYKTIAERPIDWTEMQKQLPKGTPKPHDSILKPGSLIFNKSVNAVVSMNNYQQWWTWKIGANWQHPEGPDSNIDGKDEYPVVHIAMEDALAYCKWANRRLPTEAEWESAAQGNNDSTIFTWGNDSSVLNSNANTWQGIFPVKNDSKDGFEYVSQIKSYPANSIGIYDMLGNVWELTSDLFNVNYYNEIDISKPLLNPTGATKSYSPSNPYQIENVMKGGSFLCHESYCASFRISAKMGVAQDSGSDHMGFRTVTTPSMLSTK
jgi:formylglycine-generating enzyme required for sulfatase activity